MEAARAVMPWMGNECLHVHIDGARRNECLHVCGSNGARSTTLDTVCALQLLVLVDDLIFWMLMP